MIVFAVFCLNPKAHAEIKELSSESYHMVLRNLNSKVGSWFVIDLEEVKTRKRHSFHLEIPADQRTGLDLYPEGILLGDKPCPLWSEAGFNLLKVDFKKHPDPYFPVCEEQIFVRLKKTTNTKFSSTEGVTKILRSNFPMGEGVINLMKPYLVALHAELGKDAFHSRSIPSENSGPAAARVGYDPGRVPAAAKHRLGIATLQAPSDLSYGAWYPTRMHPGVFVSLMVCPSG